MGFDKYGIDEVKGAEGLCKHIDFGDLTFNKSSFLKEWVEKYVGENINTIFDIGALEGGDSLRFTSWYPDAKVYTIEASPHNFEVMKKKFGDKKPKINMFNYAMSSENGFVDFYQTIYPDNTVEGNEFMVMGSIYDIKEEKKAKHKLKNIETIKVKAITFDSFCEENNITSVDFAHIDVEGAGFDVISGMNKTLPKMIFIEQEGIEFFKNKITGGNTNLLNLFYSKGYELVMSLPNDYLLKLK